MNPETAIEIIFKLFRLLEFVLIFFIAISVIKPTKNGK